VNHRASTSAAEFVAGGFIVIAIVALSLPCTAEASERPPDLYAVPDDAIREQVPSGVRFVPDIAYRSDTGEAGLLDLAHPEDPGEDRRPALVFVHGGGWRAGSKRRPLFVLPMLQYAAQGYVTISVNYRLAQEAPFPAAVEDVKTAVRWLRVHAAEYHVDPDRIGAYGNSAGAHLALMLALVGPDAGIEGALYPDQSSAIQAVCASAVPADLGAKLEGTPPGETMRVFLTGAEDGFAERLQRASPISYVRGDAPPMLLIHGTEDATVPVGQLDRFVEAMRAAGARDLTYLRIDGAGHMVVRQHADETDPAIAEFFARTLFSKSGS
jgi:acetyl esterase/lipase